MKKLILLIQVAILFLTLTDVYSQWYPQTSGTTNWLFDVSFTDANNGTVVGLGGTVLKTTILRTTNGGTNWSSQYIPITQATDLYGVSFIDANTGTVVGLDGTLRPLILRTTNGGTDWTIQPYPVTDVLQLNCVCFTDVNNGWAVGYYYLNDTTLVGIILRTTNGGTNWTSQTSVTSEILRGVSFTDANTGTAVGREGTILRTTNGGTNWISQTSGTTYYLSGVSLTDENNGTAVGALGTILRTTNGGTNWTSQTSGTTYGLLGVFFTDANTGTAVGYGGTILRTTNGGTNWTTQTSGTATTIRLRGVSFTDANTGTIVGDSGIILRTTNGGAQLPIPSAPLLISPANNAIGQTLNLSLVWKSVEFANIYRLQLASDTSFTNIILDDSTMTDTMKAVTNLSPLTIYYWRVNASNSAGTSAWSSIWNFTTLLAPPITPILLSPLNGSMVTTTPLLDWNDVSSATSYRMQVSEVANFMTTVIDKISLTQSNYQVPNGILSNNVKYYWRARARNAAGWSPWASAWNFTTHLTGINLIAGEIPVDFYLYSNYPNPFNPSTKIKIDIPKSSYVKLIVYDILGREIKTLVNEKLNAGRYETNWDGSSYPSGVYFYKLITDEYVSVKKMLLMK